MADGATAELGLGHIAALLAAGVVAVPVFRKIQLGSVLGYLAAGVVLGPDGLGFVQDADRILGAAEIGVVMLLFVIGLELSPARLKVMRRSVFGAGAAQVALSGLVLGGLLLLDHFQWKSALVVGVALALSSTAVGLQLLSEHKAINSDHGRLGFAILLFQDLIAIPLLAAMLRPQRRDDICRARAPVITTEHRLLDLQRIHEVDHVAGQRRRLAVAQGVFGQELRVAITPCIRHQHAVTLGREQWCDFVIAVNVVGPAVQQDHHRPIGRTGFGVGHIEQACLDVLQRAERRGRRIAGGGRFSGLRLSAADGAEQ